MSAGVWENGRTERSDMDKSKWKKPVIHAATEFDWKLVRSCLLAWDREVKELYNELSLQRSNFVGDILSGNYNFE